MICLSSQQFIQLWSLKSFWSILWINSALTARMWVGRAELNRGGDLAPVDYVAKNQDIHTHTIQSYFYFRYINANDNLLFIIQYDFL